MSKIFYSLFLCCLLGSDVWAQNSVINTAEKASLSIVEVKTVYMKALRVDPSDDTPVARARIVSYERHAAGVVIDPSGVIVANTHTIVNAPHIFVVLRDGTKLEATVAYVSPSYDFSFLKVTPPRPLPAIEWAESSQVELGQEIIGIGNSDYDDQSIMSGQVTRLLQSKSSGANELIEVNLSMYKGDSGGPILDRYGRLIGIVMAKEKSDAQATVAIPSDKIREEFLRNVRTP